MRPWDWFLSPEAAQKLCAQTDGLGPLAPWSRMNFPVQRPLLALLTPPLEGKQSPPALTALRNARMSPTRIPKKLPLKCQDLEEVPCLGAAARYLERWNRKISTG